MANKKIISYKKASRCAASLRKGKKKIVFTNGCFDILHSGHISYLSKAKQLGDVLFVGVNSDSSVRAIKGKKRPINRQNDRLDVLAALACVDYLCLFNQSTPEELIKKIRPHILVKGADWKTHEIAGASFVKRQGGKALTLPLKKGYSTSALIKKLSRLKP